MKASELFSNNNLYDILDTHKQVKLAWSVALDCARLDSDVAWQRSVLCGTLMETKQLKITLTAIKTKQHKVTKTHSHTQGHENEYRRNTGKQKTHSFSISFSNESLFLRVYTAQSAFDM